MDITPESWERLTVAAQKATIAILEDEDGDTTAQRFGIPSWILYPDDMFKNEIYFKGILTGIIYERELTLNQDN